MQTKTIKSGNMQVVIIGNSAEGPFSSRLYVNNGDTATLITRKAKTLDAASRQAVRMFAEYINAGAKAVRKHYSKIAIFPHPL